MAKKKQLVCQHLENISRKALEEYQDIVREYVRNRNGIYALYRRGKLYYVGLASNLRQRLKTHLKDRHGPSWDRFSVYLTIGDSHLKELESLLLRIVSPKGNKQSGRFVKSENLLNKFRKDVKECQKKELDLLTGRTPQRKPGLKRKPPMPIKGRKPILAQYPNHPTILKATHKSKRVTARVRKSGMINFNGKLYTSPSLAAKAAVKRRACNGWQFWTYQRSPGEWVPLDALRTGKRSPRKSKRKTKGKTSTQKSTPALSKYANRPTRLRVIYKRKRVIARVLKDGTISLNGNRYASPTAATRGVLKTQGCNGWQFWTYERAPGDWVPLDELRK